MWSIRSSLTFRGNVLPQFWGLESKHMLAYILVHRHTKRQTAFEKEIFRIQRGLKHKNVSESRDKYFLQYFSYHIHEKSNKKFWEELIVYFPLIWHGLCRKRCIQQFFYCLVYIRCRSDVLIEPLRRNDKGIHIEAHRLMGGIYKVHHWDGLRYRDIHTKFHADWFRHSNVNG
jgi:hypothetical protein